MSKEITIEDIRAWKKELDEKNIVSRGPVTFSLPQGHIGNGIYRIADGCLTNKAGWDIFVKALIKQGTELINQ